MVSIRHTDQSLDLDRCPCCGIKDPNLQKQFSHSPSDSVDYFFYQCVSCNDCITLRRESRNHRYFFDMWPSQDVAIDGVIPEKAKILLEEARDTLGSPNSSLMACASAVDVMLQEKGLKEGKLFSRINKAKKMHIVTDEMAEWADHVRLEANDIRHTNDKKSLATKRQARQTFEFAMALAEFLFVLPARVRRGRDSASKSPDDAKEAKPVP